MRVLITGTTGWLGRELANHLVENPDISVVGLGRRPTDIPGVESMCVDITKEEDMAKIRSGQNFDVIVHLSGVLGTCTMEDGIDVNVNGSRRLLQAGLAAGCKKFILGSSIAVPGTYAPTNPPKKLPFPADQPYVGGDWPYALSKHMMEEVARCIAASTDVDILLMRIGNVVTDPPEMIHHDGQGRQWQVERVTGMELGIMPECGLCTIALSDQIECLKLAVLSRKRPGVRTIACVSPSSFSAVPIPDLMRAWYGEMAGQIDMQHFMKHGHEYDAIYDLEPAYELLGWKPKVLLHAAKSNESHTAWKETVATGAVHLVITKEVPQNCQEVWLEMAAELAANTWKEDGCLDYNFLLGRESRESSTRFVIVERWESKAKLEKHRQTEHFIRLVPAMERISTTVGLDLCGDTLPVTGEAKKQRRDASSAEEVHVTVTKEVPVEAQKAWLNMALELAQGTWKEDGCLSYFFVRSFDSPTRFVIVERWASMAHLEKHFKTEHFTRLVPKMDGISSTLRIDVSVDALPIKRAKLNGIATSNDGKTGKILVLYDSATACTAQMAALVAEGARQLDRTEVRLRTVPGGSNMWDRDGRKDQTATFSDVLWADGIAAGSPTNLGCVSWRMKKFWDDLSQAGYWPKIDGKIGCSFSSVGGNAGGAELVNMAMNHIMMNFGFAVFGITDYVSFNETLHYGAVCAKAPRACKDEMVCRRLGRRLAEFVGFYIVHRPETHPWQSSKKRDLERFGDVIPARSEALKDLLKSNLLPHINLQSQKTALLFTSMKGYQHESTAAATAFFASLCMKANWKFFVSHDAEMLEVPTAPGFDLIVLINNSGQCFDTEKEALTCHINAGQPVLGVHAALAAFLDGRDDAGESPLGKTTTLIRDTFGTDFTNHPPPQMGTIHVNHKATAGLSDDGLMASMPSSFETFDEFFNFAAVPDVDGMKVLATVDESSYSGGIHGSYHPVAWHFTRGPKQAKIFYCALGHFASAYNQDGDVAKIYRSGFMHVTGTSV